MESVVLTGEQETTAVFDKLRREYPSKVVAAGLRKASKPYTRAVKSVVTPAQAKLVKVKVYTKTKQPLMYVGLSASKYASEWFKVYWQNYGTLSNRDTSHKFLYARKKRTKRWKGGIRSTKSIEKAWRDSKTQVTSAIAIEMRKAAIAYENKIKKA